MARHEVAARPGAPAPAGSLATCARILLARNHVADAVMHKPVVIARAGTCEAVSVPHPGLTAAASPPGRASVAALQLASGCVTQASGMSAAAWTEASRSPRWVSHSGRGNRTISAEPRRNSAHRANKGSSKIGPMNPQICMRHMSWFTIWSRSAQLCWRMRSLVVLSGGVLSGCMTSRTPVAV